MSRSPATSRRQATLPQGPLLQMPPPQVPLYLQTTQGHHVPLELQTTRGHQVPLRPQTARSQQVPRTLPWVKEAMMD